jgi:anti-sigma factor RsiW
MDHQEVVRRGVIEKYLLNEIPEAERDDFERHFFGCQECAEEMRTTAAFLAGAKLELRRSHLTPPLRAGANKSRFDILRRPAVAAPAFVLLLLMVAYQTIIILPRFAGEGARPKDPEILTPLSLSGNARDGAVPITAIVKGQPLLLSLDIPTAERFSSYACVLVAPSGAVVWRLPVSAIRARNTVAVSVPSGSLSSGNYRLLVQGRANAGADPVDLATYRFILNGSN